MSEYETANFVKLLKYVLRKNEITWASEFRHEEHPQQTHNVESMLV